jgi:hypothetical protein
MINTSSRCQLKSSLVIATNKEIPHLEQGLCVAPASAARPTTVSMCARNIETSNTRWNFQWSEVGNFLPTELGLGCTKIHRNF